MDTKQTHVQTNTKNLNYSGTEAILWSLSFSHPPSQCRGFNPVMSVSGSLLVPAPRRQDPLPLPLKTRGRTPGSLWSRWLPRPLFGRAPGRMPLCCFGIPRLFTQRGRSIPRRIEGDGLMPEGEQLGAPAAASGEQRPVLTATQHSTAQRTTQRPFPPLPPSRNSWAYHSHLGHHSAYKSNVK